MSALLARRAAWQALLAAIAVTLAVQWIPYLRVLGWPLLLGSTLAHELGHGFAAMALGGRFESMDLYADGSGVASYRGAFGSLQIALVAATGLLGPPLVAWALLFAGRSVRASHALLGSLALVLGVVAVWWAGNPLTLLYCSVLAAALGLAAWRGGARLCQVLCVFMAVQLALFSFSRADYLFTAVAETGQGRMLSDVGQIAAAVWLPYWLWGGLIAALSLGLLLLGAWQFLRVLR